MRVKIITDSTSDISQAEARELNITVVPLRTIFGQHEYLDGVTLSPEEFYEKLPKSKELPTTSQPSPYDFEQAFTQPLSEGDDIIVLCLPETISGTYQSANIAKNNVGGRIWVIDSGTTTLGLKILVKFALGLRDAGKSAEEIVSAIEEEKKSICLYAAIDTLDYFVKGGRLSKTSAFAGALLRLKPIVSFIQGSLKVAGKCHGLKKAYAELLRLVEDSGGIDFSKPYSIGYAGDRSRLDQFELLCKQTYSGHEPIIGCIGCVIGTHAGPGAVAIAFFKKPV